MTRDYIGGIEYVNDTLDAIYHSEGRIKYIDEVARYEYYIRDHLGNIRLTYSDLNADGLITTPDEILEEMHYYAFGMMMEGSWMGVAGQYGYNGIEYENFLDLEMNLATYRGLDPTLGRWWQVDPKAEALYGLSPYNSMGNNPVRNIDPNGDLFFAIPQISFNGGFSIGLEVGFGVPGKSISATGMVGAQSSWSIQGRAFGFYAGYGSSGAFAGYGYQWNGFSAGFDFGSGTASLGFGGGFGNMNNASVGLSYGKGGFGYNAGVSSAFMWGSIDPPNTAEQGGHGQLDDVPDDGRVYGTAGLHPCEPNAYKIMVDQTAFKNIETSAWLTLDGVAIMPYQANGKRNTASASANNYYRRGMRGKKFVVLVDGKWRVVIGQIHTHPSSDRGLSKIDLELLTYLGNRNAGTVYTIGPNDVHYGFQKFGENYTDFFTKTRYLLSGRRKIIGK